MFQGTRDGLENRYAKKRVHIPKLYAEELETNSEEDDQEQQRKERKRRKINRAAAKSSAYKAFLNDNLQASLMSSIGKASGSARGTKVGGKRSTTPSFTSSEEDSLCAKSELDRALKEKKMWKNKALNLEKQNELLLSQVASLQRCLEAKIFDLETRATTSNSEGAARWQNLVANDHTVPEHSASKGPGCSSWSPAERRDAEFVELPLPVQNEAPAAVQPQAPKQDFSYTEDGST
ncbi:uncharacterized protein LOC144127993 isoform X2 [Amblyomma americanum]